MDQGLNFGIIRNRINTYTYTHMPLVTVSRHNSPGEAELVLTLLADAGIPAHLAGAPHPTAVAFFGGDDKGIRIEVPEEHAEAALELLNATGDFEDIEG